MKLDTLSGILSTFNGRNLGQFRNQFRTLVSKLVPRSNFAKGVTILTGGTLLVKLIGIVASPILTRLYLPEDYGALSVFASIIGIGSVFASLRYELAIPLPADDKTASNLILLSGVLVVCMTGLSCIAIGFFGDNIVEAAKTPDLKPYLWLLPVGLLSSGGYKALNYWAVRKKAFGTITKTRLNQSISALAIQFSVIFLVKGPLGLLLGSIVGSAAGVTTLLFLYWRTGKEYFPTTTLSDILSSARRYKKFPLISSWSAVANASGLLLPAILLAVIYGPKVAGFYGLVNRLLGLPVDMIGNSVGKVYLATTADHARGSRSALMPVFKSTAKKMFLLGFLPFLALMIVGPFIIGPVFGKAWEEAGMYVRVLSPMFLMQFVVRPVSTISIVIERQGLQLIWDLLRLATILTVFGLSYFGQYSAVDTLAYYSASNVLLYFLVYFMYRKALSKYIASRGQP